MNILESKNLLKLNLLDKSQDLVIYTGAQIEKKKKKRRKFTLAQSVGNI